MKVNYKAILLLLVLIPFLMLAAFIGFLVGVLFEAFKTGFTKAKEFQDIALIERIK